ncbi:restin (Reed-Steinberg cell-expressed intermediate filament-associated protein) [Aphelenchoides avenae]|nr:restin (Reed-Steinberg cell-expressed intermediate filament-associated protein) [Aphelenchus avenae]
MKEMNKLREQVVKAERQDNETKRLNQKLETANKELHAARKDADAAHQMADARREQTTRLRKERDEALAEAKKMRRARDDLDTERAKTEHLRRAVRELEQECDTLRTERNNLVAERDKLKVKLDTSQKLIEECTKLLHAAASQPDASRQSEEQHAATQRSLKDAQHTCVKLQYKLARQKTSHDTQLAQLRSELDAANSELRQAERFIQKLDTLPKRKEMLKLAVLIQQRKDLLRKRLCFNCGKSDGSPPSSASSASVEASRQLARQALSSSSYYHACPFGELSSDDTSTGSFVPGDNKSPESDAGYCAESPEGEDGSYARKGDGGTESTRARHHLGAQPKPGLYRNHVNEFCRRFDADQLAKAKIGRTLGGQLSATFDRCTGSRVRFMRCWSKPTLNLC